MTNLFKKFIESNNFRYGTIHDLRRSFNTLLKEYGYPTDWILDIMCHVDDRVNRNHYTGSIRVDVTKVNNIAL
jgi:integrase